MKWDFKTAEDRLNFGEEEVSLHQKYLSFNKGDILAGLATLAVVLLLVLYMWI
jgi:hypothetical protein